MISRRRITIRGIQIANTKTEWRRWSRDGIIQEKLRPSGPIAKRPGVERCVSHRAARAPVQLVTTGRLRAVVVGIVCDAVELAKLGDDEDLAAAGEEVIVCQVGAGIR